MDETEQPPDAADQPGSDQGDAEGERLQHVAQHPTDGRQGPEQDVNAQDQSEQSAGDHDEPDDADHRQQPRPDRGTAAARHERRQGLVAGGRHQQGAGNQRRDDGAGRPARLGAADQPGGGGDDAHQDEPPDGVAHGRLGHQRLAAEHEAEHDQEGREGDVGRDQHQRQVTFPDTVGDQQHAGDEERERGGKGEGSGLQA